MNTISLISILLGIDPQGFMVRKPSGADWFLVIH